MYQPFESSRALWDASNLWSEKKSRRLWSPAVLTEFFRWYASRPDGDQLPSNAQLGRQLPGLSRFARLVRCELTRGSGVTWLAAPEGDWHESTLRSLYLVLGTLMGRPLDPYGTLYEVKDRGADHRQKRIPVSQTSASTSLHTDSSSVDVQPDLVGLLCLQPAPEGGESRITSALTAHERLRESCPELLEQLYADFVRDVVTPGTQPTIEQRLRNRFPIFYNDFARGLNFRYMRFWIETGHARAGAPLDDIRSRRWMRWRMRSRRRVPWPPFRCEREKCCGWTTGRLRTTVRRLWMTPSVLGGCCGCGSTCRPACVNARVCPVKKPLRERRSAF